MILEFVGDFTLLRINEATPEELQTVKALCTGKVDRFRAKHKPGWDGTVMYAWYVDKHWHVPAGCWKRIWDLRKPDPQTYRPAYNIQFVNANAFFNKEIQFADVQAFVDDLALQFDDVKDQTTALYNILVYRMSTHHIATGFGKTCLSYMLAQWTHQNLQGKTLMIVPRIILVEQGIADMHNYQQNCEDKMKVYGICSGYRNECSFNDADLFIGTFQSLAEMPDDMFTEITTVIVDEAHTGKALSIKEIIGKCKNAKIKTGISGTMTYMNAMDKLTVESYLGPQILTYNVRDQIDKGRLPNVAIMPVTLKYDFSFRDNYDALRQANMLPAISPEAVRELGGDFKRLEFNFMFTNKAMFNFLLVLCKAHTDRNQNVLVIFKNRQPCINFFEYANEIGRKCHLIFGPTDGKTRYEVKAQIEREQGWILVASTGTMAMGVSINNLEAAILCMIEHSAHTALQSVGRMLRKHENKDATTVVYDVASDISAFGTKFDIRHQCERIALYNKEQYQMLKHAYRNVADYR